MKMIKQIHFLLISCCYLNSLIAVNANDYKYYKQQQLQKQSDAVQYSFSSPYSSEKYEGKTYPYLQDDPDKYMEIEEEDVPGDPSRPYKTYIREVSDAKIQSPGYRMENDPPTGGLKKWEDGERMGEMPKGDEGKDPAKEYQDPSCPNLFYRYEAEYYNDWQCEHETRYRHKRHCRYVPQYYQKRCCVYVPQYYYVTRVAYVPEYYYSAKRDEVPNYYSVPKLRYKKRYYYKTEPEECQYLEPDDTECVYGRP